jgi:intracellular multiplication protein IcmC
MNADLNTIINALRDNAEPITRFVIATAYVIGFWFIISAIGSLRRIGQSSMMQAQMGMGGPLVKLVIGLLLFYLPTTVNMGVMTFWGSDSSIVGYHAASGDVFGPLKDGVVAIVRVVGYISLVKGLVILSRAAEQGAQQGTFSKGITHVIGGILAVNIVGTIGVISSTLGIKIF